MSVYDINKKYLKTPIQEFVFWEKYARYNEEEGRRETWPEAVRRVIDFLKELVGDRRALAMGEEFDILYEAILSGDISPSMRLFSAAGEEARRNQVSLYNCCFIPMQSFDAIAELMWVSMSGVGAGYSVERKFTGDLPFIRPRRKGFRVPAFVIEDSAEGWVSALRYGLDQWAGGHDVAFNYSHIRPAGAPLKTKGGTASGPEVLRDMLNFVRDIIFDRAGLDLRPIDVFDICTKIGMCVVSGGNRRSAQLAMFDLDDTNMVYAKAIHNLDDNPHRSVANISVVLEEPQHPMVIDRILTAMHENHSGEPGIISRYAMEQTKPRRRRSLAFDGGVNACAEIVLRGTTKDGRYGGQFCNLTTALVRPTDHVADIRRKVALASLLGTIQATATNFTNLRSSWKEICEEEHLLGVSLVGLTDLSEEYHDVEFLDELRNVAVSTNARWSAALGISPAAAVTCIKPAGNSSTLYDTPRGLNARYAPYYIRRVRVGAHTSMYGALKESGVPLSPENYQTADDATVWVASFLSKSPEGALTSKDMSALDQLDLWLKVKQGYTEHNPSVTIQYKEHELPGIIDWVANNQRWVNGISFLPYSNGYQQAPYEEVTREVYEGALAAFPPIDFSIMRDGDRGVRDLECGGLICELAPA